MESLSLKFLRLLLCVTDPVVLFIVMSALCERYSFEKEINKLEVKKMNKKTSYELKKNKKKCEKSKSK